MSDQQARQDKNQVHALIGHSSVNDPSETRRVVVGDYGDILTKAIGSDGTTPTTANYVLFDADSSAPDYIGVNDDADANTSDTDWTIYKFVYSGSNKTSIRKKTGAWDDRATLF